MTDPENGGVLAGVRVLDLGRFIAGPYCATLLSDLGADVIRIEAPGGGEDRFVVPVAPSGEGGSFLQTGRNKRAVCRTSVRKAAAMRCCDWPPPRTSSSPTCRARSSRARHGLRNAVAAVSPQHPRHGHRVWRRRSAGGAARLRRRRAGDVGGGLALGPARCAGALGRDLCRFRHRRGLRLRRPGGAACARPDRPGAARAGLAAAHRHDLLQFQPDGGRGDRPQSHAERQPEPATGAFGPVRHARRARAGPVLGNAQFHRLAMLIGHGEWVADAELQSDAARGRQRDRICEAVGAWCAQHTCAQALAQLAAQRIPGCKVLSPPEALSDPQVRGGGHLREMDYPSLPKPLPVAAPLVELSATPPRYRHRAPLPGEHTREVLEEAGFTPEEIERLRVPHNGA
ncbi:hypothetical protein HK414_26060 [Ramlibacter terrae]|uniref:CoA transferase n=1 Tax=Ramlibacter terrae TaxID=2732511 RepID=A0ABX6P7Q8_9BURK|nr:hypothetical protein HK414_26060 [Ramlibacter terrae]